MRLDEFLQHRQIPHRRLPHQLAYTANRLAQALHVPGQEVAKTVLLRTPHGYIVAVLPATHRVDLDRVRQHLGEAEAELATEDEIQHLFPDCEPGAMPPFGSLYQLPTLVDESLAEDDEIVFEGQTHMEAFRMRYRDYVNTEHPQIGRYALCQ